MGIVIQATTMIFSFQDFRMVLPELILISGILFIFFSDTFFESTFSPTARLITLAGFVIAALIPLFAYTEPTQSYLIESTYLITQVRIFLLAAVLLFLIHTGVSGHHTNAFILYCILGAAIGVDLFVLSRHWIMLFVGMETLSICSYLLVANTLLKNATEASVKYLLIGVASSAIMLFGISLWYGIQGNLEFTFSTPLLLAPGILIWILVISGLLFKISAPPFHFWIPDAYQGSTNPVVLYLSTAPKVAGIFVLWKIYYAQASYPSADQLRILLSGISVMAIVWGSLAALKQNNLKRMFAYSSVAHAGLFLSGFLSVSSIQVSNVLFYFWIYLFALLSALLLLDYFEKITGSSNVNQFKGLGARMPLAGAVFVFIMIALTGLPPTAIFYGKLFIFTGLLSAYSESGTILYLILFIAGVTGTLFSLFFYLKGPYYMYFKTSEYTSEELKPNKSVALAFASAIPVLVFFLNPDWLMKLLR